jgi:hypothetical protein
LGGEQPVDQRAADDPPESHHQRGKSGTDTEDQLGPPGEVRVIPGKVSR